MESSSSVEDKIVNVEGWSHSQSPEQPNPPDHLPLLVLSPTKPTLPTKPLHLASIIQQDNVLHENTLSVHS